MSNGQPFFISIRYPFLTSIRHPFLLSIRHPCLSSIRHPFLTSIRHPYLSSVQHLFSMPNRCYFSPKNHPQPKNLKHNFFHLKKDKFFYPPDNYTIRACYRLLLLTVALMHTRFSLRSLQFFESKKKFPSNGFCGRE